MRKIVDFEVDEKLSPSNFGVRYVHVLSNRETIAQLNYSLVRRVYCRPIVQAWVASSTISANQKQLKESSIFKRTYKTNSSLTAQVLPHVFPSVQNGEL